MTPQSSERDIVRFLRRLSSGSCPAEGTADALVTASLARGLIAADGNDAWILTSTGVAMLRRALSNVDGFAAQHQERARTILNEEHGAAEVIVNHSESPLAWLRRRRDRDGRPMVAAPEFAAGERLRADYERGHMMPRVTANWTASVAGGRRDGGIAELTEAAMSARRRVERALKSVGPELGGLLVDFCCFLKGLEEIERERQWPARSAKVVLRLGLASLARHYGLSGEAEGVPSRKLRHWGAEDYRPVID